MSRQIGKRSEARALAYLQSLGYSFLDKNIFSDQGEIDLIVIDQSQVLHFVEVKYRQKIDEMAFESITAKKQKSMIHTARCYMDSHQTNIRFQAHSFSVLLHDDNEWFWIPDAFDGD